MADVDVSFYPKSNPNALLETTGGFLGVQQQALAARQAHMDLVKGQVDYLANGLGALASKPDLTPEDMIGFGQRSMQQGIIDPKTFEAEMQQISAASGDPAQLRALATQYQLRALSAGEKFAAQFGTPSMVDNGNQLMPVTVSSLTGIHPIGEPIQKTLSPTELAAPTQIGTTEEGQPIQGTQGQFLERAGVNPLTAMPQGSASNMLAPAPQGGNTSTASPIQQSTEGVVTTLPVGAVPALEAVGRSGGEALAADLSRERTFQQDVTPLEKAIPALEALGTTGTGPGTEQINEIKSFLQSMGLPIADVEQIKNFDEANKYLTQFVRASGDTGTNDKLAAAFAGNPSVGISNAAATDVVKTALTLRRLQNAQVQAFRGAPDQYLKFAADFNAAQDPRAYGFDLMSPKQRADLIGGLSTSEKAKFVKSLRTAVELGLVSPPQAAE